MAGLFLEDEMTNEQRRFMHAKQRLMESHVNPITELLGACTDMVAKANRERDQAVTTMEVLRPVWAQGFTSDAQAASANGNALAEIWQLLGVDNQTAAVARLKELIK